tara:strand:+ start:652 stop:1626 length:975 start_codon:yes stop_codon:yes gene_type:complete
MYLAKKYQFRFYYVYPITVLNVASLQCDLAAMNLSTWLDDLQPLIDSRIADESHGQLRNWRNILNNLPTSQEGQQHQTEVRDLLIQLVPWRKGPFDLNGVHVDSEWRSDMKWNRLKDKISPLDNRQVLDVGCGNGYYILRMLEAGANYVIGIDPTILFVIQFEAIRKLTGIQSAHVLPLKLEELPPLSNAFDTVFSMGVLYHRRNPKSHLSELLGALQPGGELVLETLVLPGKEDRVFKPSGRYARMRNVWHLPTVSALQKWLVETGFVDAHVIDITVTTTDEQRTTNWMPYESLAEALNPKDPKLTLEGLPAPTRAIILCQRP